MSGYASKADAVTTLRLSIIKDSANTGLTRDPADYNLAALVRETVTSRGSGYGWSIEMDSTKFIEALRRNVRVRRRSRLRPFSAADFQKITGEPLSTYSRNCHAASLRLVRSGVLGPARVARGTCRGVGGQHSWVVLGMDCYAPDVTVVDPTLWSYVDTLAHSVYVGPPVGHRPHGTGSIWDYGQPVTQGGEIIEFDRTGLSGEALAFLDLLDPLDRSGWMTLANSPVQGWPAAEILGRMYEDDRMSSLPPIDIIGMLTDKNPSGLYLAGTRKVDGQLRMEAKCPGH